MPDACSSLLTLIALGVSSCFSRCSQTHLFRFARTRRPSLVFRCSYTARLRHRLFPPPRLPPDSAVMCPFRVLVIFFSLLIALCATLAALADDPREDDELQQDSSAASARWAAKSTSAKAWYYFVDFWSGRYLCRESKRLMPCLFGKEETTSEEQEESSSSSNSELAESAAEAEASAPEEDLPAPSAPESDSDPHDSSSSKHSSSSSSLIADAAFDSALQRRLHRSHGMGVVGAVIS